jgi:glutamyl-tRNA synthetase
MENVSRRKLSKRKDPEASMSYYEEKGYPKQAILEYLLNLASSDFEDWRKNNPQRDFKEFEISIKKLASHPG